MVSEELCPSVLSAVVGQLFRKQDFSSTSQERPGERSILLRATNTIMLPSTFYTHGFGVYFNAVLATHFRIWCT